MTETELNQRAGRSLVNTFPFNSADTSLPSRIDRQGGNDVAVDFASVAAAGKRCIDKVEEVEETEYDEEVKKSSYPLHHHPHSSFFQVLCDHSYDRRCHTSYTTTYSAQQEEECDENYKKSCFIEYSKTAVQAEVQICVEPLIKDCDAPGPEVCRYEANCARNSNEVAIVLGSKYRGTNFSLDPRQFAIPPRVTAYFCCKTFYGSQHWRLRCIKLVVAAS